MKKENNTNTIRYYLVAVTIKAEGFNKILLEGIFTYQKGEYTIPEIKKECWDFLKPLINFKDHDIDPEQVRNDIKVKSMPCDFFLNGDKK